MIDVGRRRVFIADYSCIERFYRDVRPFRLYEGASQIHQVTIARMTMKRAAEQRSADRHRR